MELSLYLVNAIARGYFYECSCGELFATVESAQSCRKCRTYTDRGCCSEVHDVATGEMVWELPWLEAERRREAELAAYRAEAARPFTIADHINKSELITAIL